MGLKLASSLVVQLAVQKIGAQAHQVGRPTSPMTGTVRNRVLPRIPPIPLVFWLSRPRRRIRHVELDPYRVLGACWRNVFCRRDYPQE